MDSMPVSDLPFVSVLMPAYQVQGYIAQAIQSVLDQTYSHFELIISDDGSTDQTVEVIRSFTDSRITLIRNEKNLGYAENINVLFRAAKGELLVMQDADDYARTNRLHVLTEFLTAHPQVDVVGSSYIKVDDAQKEEEIKVPIDRDEIQKSFLLMNDPLPVLNGTLMFRRKIVDEGFFFRPLVYVNRAQDDDWLFRLSEKFVFANVNEPLYCYRFNASSMTLNPSFITYNSLFAGDYVRFLKSCRKEKGIDLLAEKDNTAVEKFFHTKIKSITDAEPAYLELYIAHKYLAQAKKKQTLQWLLKALLKDTGNSFIWKKIVFVLFNS